MVTTTKNQKIEGKFLLFGGRGSFRLAPALLGSTGKLNNSIGNRSDHRSGLTLQAAHQITLPQPTIVCITAVSAF